MLTKFQTEDDPKGTSGSLVNSWQMESGVPDISVEIIPKNTPNNDATKVFLIILHSCFVYPKLSVCSCNFKFSCNHYLVLNIFC